MLRLTMRMIQNNPQRRFINRAEKEYSSSTYALTMAYSFKSFSEQDEVIVTYGDESEGSSQSINLCQGRCFMQNTYCPKQLALLYRNSIFSQGSFFKRFIFYVAIRSKENLVSQYYLKTMKFEEAFRLFDGFERCGQKIKQMINICNGINVSSNPNSQFDNFQITEEKFMKFLFKPPYEEGRPIIQYLNDKIYLFFQKYIQRFIIDLPTQIIHKFHESLLVCKQYPEKNVDTEPHLVEQFESQFNFIQLT